VCRAEVIGSLLRPASLKEARAAFERGELSPHDFKRVEDRAVHQVIAMQEGSADGEMRRYLFMVPITETVDGIEPVDEGNPMPWTSPDGELEWSVQVAVTSKLRKKRSLVTEAYSYARARARCP
jgi:5-methyltetrahydropteroyltriglutamate--homocysteine methyltransferase